LTVTPATRNGRHARPASPPNGSVPARPLTPAPADDAEPPLLPALAHAAPIPPIPPPMPAAQPAAGRGWLRGAMTALAALAAGAAVVSWNAQYEMVHAARRATAVAAIEAGIPDAGALIFAALGIALALHGRRALRPRALNLACVALSLTMNAMAAGHGWRDTAIWVMPAAIYALASDTLIGVVRAWALAREHATGQALDADDTTPLAIAGATILWLLRLALAPASTLAGFRRWVIDECPVAPGRKATPAQPPLLPPEPAPVSLLRYRPDGRPAKQDLLIALASQRHDLHRLPLTQAAAIAAKIGAEVDLHPGTARRILKAHIQALQTPDRQ